MSTGDLDAWGRGFHGRSLSRRTWLGIGAASWVALTTPRLHAQRPRNAALTAKDEKVVADVRSKAKAAGLGPLEVRWTEHFLGVGDAPPRDYIARALEICETFGREFRAHFRDRGFSIEFPDRRLTLVALKDAASYQAFSGEEPDIAVGGHYDLEANQLVVFDFRPDGAGQAAGARRTNTFTLIHETAHLLCYNMGLLPMGRDVPVAISEGLATYAEPWVPPRDRTAFGRVNVLRLPGLGNEWIPIPRLLVDDSLFEQEETANLAYVESWLLVHYLMRQPERLPRFRAYLADLPKPGDNISRAAYAESKLGSLRDLDAAVQRHARAVRRRRR